MGLNYDTWAGALEQGQRPYKNHQHNFSGPGPEGLTNRDRVRQYIGHFGAAGGGVNISTHTYFISGNTAIVNIGIPRFDRPHFIFVTLPPPAGPPPI